MRVDDGCLNDIVRLCKEDKVGTETTPVTLPVLVGNGERVVPCPIVDTWDVNGKKSAKIVGFAAFFLVNKPQGGGAGSFATGQFINYIVPGNSDGNTPVGPKLFSVRLIPNQT